MLTAFGVFWGIFILVIILGASKGFENGIKEKVAGIATNSAFFWSKTSSIPYKGYNAGRSWNITNYDIEGIKSVFADLDLIAPMLDAPRNADNVVYGEMKDSYAVQGQYPDFFKIIPFEVLKGRLLNERDITEVRKVCVIGERIEEELFKGKNPINEAIRVNGVYFRIVGVIRPRTENVTFGSNPKETVTLPFTTLQRTYGYGNIVNSFSITAKKGVKVSKLESKIKAYLLKNHDFSPEDKKAVGSFNFQEIFEQFNGVFIGINFLAFIVGLGTLLAGIVGVSNIMLIVIKERTKEIGIKRALGAQSGVIRGQILFESVLLTVFAGFLGLFISVVLLELVGMITDSATKDAEIHFVPQADLQMGLIALFILVVGGLFAGLFPASKAIRIKPIDALRDE